MSNANGRSKLVFPLTRSPQRARRWAPIDAMSSLPRLHAWRQLPNESKEVMQAMSAGLGGCEFRALLTSRPTFNAREHSLAALAQTLPLPQELLLHIFGFLDERSLARLERVSHAMFELAGKLQVAIDPSLEPWASEVAHCEQALAQSRVEYSQPRTHSRAEERLRRAGIFEAHDNKLKFELARLAASKRCLFICVWPGIEAAVATILAEGCGWQAAIISVHKQAHKFPLMQLEQDLSSKGRRRELHLQLSNTSCLQGFKADSNALLLTRLQVLPDISGDLSPLRSLLAGPNRIESLSMTINVAHADDLVGALASGCPVLTSLRLQQHAPANLPFALKTKSGLRALELLDCSLQAPGLSLAALLQAVPSLEVLNLGQVKFEAGSTADCAQALEKSALRVISFLGCQLFMQDRSCQSSGQLKTEDPGKHGELALGLQHAPLLAELRLAGDTEAGEIFLLEAFAHNPAARSVRFDDPAVTAQPGTIERLDAIRRQSYLPPLKFS